MKYIDALFDNMDSWRHLPAYQLERRADIFFSIYLPDILRDKLGVEIEGIIPEFPIRIGTIYPKADINKSFKVDYLAGVRCSQKVVFVELKTDDSSRRGKQDWYLEKARQVGMVELLNGVLQIYQASASKRKYRHLLASLQEMGFCSIGNSGEVSIPQANYEIDLVYLQPSNADALENIISFPEAAEVIRKHGDALSLRFATSLLKWAKVKAGEA